ncbi:hypothetical protein [Clostridium tertium]|uniref:hypothetical protein n=1 Tax=Clostridium tertium TaxID=1559 RepID=UPI0018AC57CB|nr:hypothetical protein [Clostridium tertium]
MNYEKICELIKGIIENEFNHIQEFKEVKFTDEDEEQKVYENNTRELFDKLNVSLTKEQQNILDDFDAAVTNEFVNLCRFYFKEGIAAGLTNLNYLNDIDSVGSYIE